MSGLAERDVALRMIARLESGDRLSVLVGSGIGAARIDLAPAYADVIRDELLRALRQKAAHLAAAIAAAKDVGHAE